LIGRLDIHAPDQPVLEAVDVNHLTIAEEALVIHERRAKSPLQVAFLARDHAAVDDPDRERQRNEREPREPRRQRRDVRGRQ
jgi:hypothetical protein